MKFEERQPPDPEEIERVEVKVAAARCPFCHELVTPELARLACNSCGAWHHQDCWQEGAGACSSCGSSETGVRREAALAGSTEFELPSQPFAVAGTAATAILGGGLIGSLTNWINSSVSPGYYRTILGWQDVEEITRAIVAQGLYEGVLYGVAFAVVFSCVLAIGTRVRSSYRFALKHLLLLAAGVLVSWAVGGGIAMGLATLSPEFYRGAFRGVPEDSSGMLRYAWVGGSIWGALIGGLLSGTVGSALAVLRWKHSAGRRSPRLGSPFPLARSEPSA